jgi:hypothetical protein
MNASIDGDRFNEPKEATSAVIAAFMASVLPQPTCLRDANARNPGAQIAA